VKPADLIKRRIQIVKPADLIKHVDVEVLRLQPGDVVMLSIDPHHQVDFSALDEFDLGDFREHVVDAFRGALTKAGHDKIGLVVVEGVELKLQLVRTDTDAESEAE
jgi:hypothetical protein